MRTVQHWLGHTDMEGTMLCLKPSRSEQTRAKVNEIIAGYWKLITLDLTDLSVVTYPAGVPQTSVNVRGRTAVRPRCSCYGETAHIA